MARVREIDLDLTLDAPEAPLARVRAGQTQIAEAPAADAPADGAAAGPFDPAPGDVAGNVADLGGGVLAPNLGAEPPTVIHGTAGNDVIYGTPGNDVIRGLAGDDIIIAGDGRNSVSGDAGNDLIVGGSGYDEINGNAGDDWLRGNAGNDSLWGADGNDGLQGGDGDDRLEGGAGQDWLFGDAGNDTLRGGDDADVIHGGAGNDRIDGGQGVDTLIGGAGRDHFIARPDDVLWNAHFHQSDVVTDFNPYGSVDRDSIDLRLIMDATEFTGTTAQEAHDQGFLRLQQYQRIDEAGNVTHGTIVVVDRNGSAPQQHGEGIANVFMLEGVQTHELSFTAFAGHFLV